MNTCKNRVVEKLKHIKTYGQHVAKMQKNIVAWAKEQTASCISLCKKGYSFLQNAVPERIKRLMFSGMVSCGVIASVAVILACTCSVGCEIAINGQIIGTAKNASEYTALIERINREIAYVTDSDFTPAAEPTFSTKIIAKNDFTSEAEMAERLKATSNDMLPAYSVSVDDEIIFALTNEEAALSVLTDYKNSFLEGTENGSATFCQDVTVSHSFVPKSALKTEETAALALQKGRFKVYQLSEGESLNSVCDQFNITIDDLLQNNIIKDINKLEPGTLKIPTGEPLILVETKETTTIEEVIPYNTIEEEDASLYEGSMIIKQEGADGLKVVNAIITSVNGVETGRDVLSENLLSAAVDHIVQKGTKKLPKATGGGMAVPANGTLTSRFGSRWGRNHNGIDMSASVGTAIYAADNGTVTYSEYNNGGFGYLMKIDHGNGLETYYAHCSELLVPAGTVVAKGDVIAKVGNTGRSTGPHLHFEVRLNGTPIDPMQYLTSFN